MKLLKTGDTVVTYNLPVSVVTNIDRSGPLQKGFLLSFDKIVKLTISQKWADEKEKIWPLCTAIHDISGFSKFNNKQIIILSQEK